MTHHTGGPPHSLSVVIPLYNEVDNVAPLLAQLHDSLAAYPGPWELILVDDGSRDGTGRALTEQAAHYGGHVRVVRLSRNYGQTAAMQAGLDAARGRFIATLDGDLQNDPADIPRMVEQLERDDLDLLAGWRRNRQDTLIRRFPSKLANWLIRRTTGVQLSDYGCSLKVYRTSVIKQVTLYGEMHRFIPAWMAAITPPDRIGETVVNHRAREHGASKYGLSRTFRVIIDLLSVYFFMKYRARPGHFFGSIGLFFGLLGGLPMVYLAYVKFILGEDIGGRPLFMVSILFLIASIQFLTTGVLAELVARTYFESSNRRPYIALPEESPAGADDWHEPSRDPDAASLD